MTKTLAEEINYKSMSGGDFLQAVGMDGKLWTDAFIQMWGDKLNEIDHGLMLGWFCNAIMAGYDEYSKKNTTLTNAIIILPDDAEPEVGDFVWYKNDINDCESVKRISGMGVSHAVNAQLSKGIWGIIFRKGKPTLYESQLKTKQGE